MTDDQLERAAAAVLVLGLVCGVALVLVVGWAIVEVVLWLVTLSLG